MLHCIARVDLVFTTVSSVVESLSCLYEEYCCVCRKRRGSPSQSKPQGTKRRHVKNKVVEQEVDNGREEEESDSEEESQLAARSTNPPQASTTTRYVYDIPQ